MIKKISIEQSINGRAKASRIIIDFDDGYRVCHEMPNQLNLFGLSKQLHDFAAFIYKCGKAREQKP